MYQGEFLGIEHEHALEAKELGDLEVGLEVFEVVDADMDGIDGYDTTGTGAIGNGVAGKEDTLASYIVLATEVGDIVLTAEGHCNDTGTGLADVLDIHHSARGLDEGDNLEGAHRDALLILDGLEELTKEVDILALGGLGVHEAMHAIDGELVGVLQELTTLAVVDTGKDEFAAEVGALHEGLDIVAGKLLVGLWHGILDIQQEDIGIAAHGAIEQLLVVRRHKHEAAHQVGITHGNVS